MTDKDPQNHNSRPKVQILGSTPLWLEMRKTATDQRKENNKARNATNVPQSILRISFDELRDVPYDAYISLALTTDENNLIIALGSIPKSEVTPELVAEKMDMDIEEVKDLKDGLFARLPEALQQCLAQQYFRKLPAGRLAAKGR